MHLHYIVDQLSDNLPIKQQRDLLFAKCIVLAVSLHDDAVLPIEAGYIDVVASFNAWRCLALPGVINHISLIHLLSMCNAVTGARH